MIRIQIKNKKKEKYEQFLILEETVKKVVNDFWSKKTNHKLTQKSKYGFWDQIWNEMNQILCGTKTMLEFLCEKFEAHNEFLMIDEKYKNIISHINCKYNTSTKNITREDSKKISKNMLMIKKEKIKLILIQIATAEFSILQEIKSNVNEEDFCEKGKLKWVWKIVFNSYEEIWQKKYIYTDRDGEVQIVDSKEQGIRLNNYYVGKTKISVCPYCNHNFVNNRHKDLGAQLDHFYPRSRYPLFSFALYNLIPVCGTCNRLKGDIFQTAISPYEDFDFQNGLRFSYVQKEYKTKLNVDQMDIVIYTTPDETGRSIAENIEELKVQYAYQVDKEYVADLIKKALIYNEETLRYLETEFPDLFHSRKEILRFLSESLIEEEDYLRYPRAKLTHDVLKEMGYDFI